MCVSRGLADAPVFIIQKNIMLLNHPVIVVALACAINALVFVMFNSPNTTPNDNKIATIAKVLAANAIALGCLFMAFGENRPDIYVDPVNF